jgi:hypothetical protein
MTEHFGHLVLILAPLILVVFFGVRRQVPLVAMLFLLHGHTDPLPSSLSTPPPMCCTLAQGVEPSSPDVPLRQSAFSVPVSRSIVRRPEFVRKVPAIRAPPGPKVPPTPVSWIPVSRAA